MFPISNIHWKCSNISMIVTKPVKNKITMRYNMKAMSDTFSNVFALNLSMTF